MSKKLSIIIVNWNGRAILPACVDSILANPPAFDYEVVVVDNDSSDGSVDWLREKQKELNGILKVILNNENLGFGKANNQAMRASRSDYFLLLNSDTEVTPHSIDTLLELAESDPKIGVVAPRLVNKNGLTQATVFRNPPTPWEVLLTGFRLHRILPKKLRGELLLGTFWDHDKVRDATFICGAAMLIKREVFDTVGGFDEEFFMYGEDAEYSLRIVRAGFRMVFTPESQVIHIEGQSSFVKWEKFEKIKVQTRGFLRFQEKSLSRRHVVANCLANYLVLNLENTARKLRGMPRVDVEANLQVYRDLLRKYLLLRN